MERRETRQRETVLATAKNLYHPSAEEVYFALQKKGLKVGRATVFRNLAVLCEENKLKKICFQDQPSRFDTSVAPHDHFVCVKCGRIIDLENNEKKEEFIDNNGLKVLSKSVTYYGLCEACLKKEE